MGKFASYKNSFLKKFMPDLVGYSRISLVRDVVASATAGIIALPLSLALAIATGVPPILGLYTAGIAGFITALCAGSQFSVSGPAAATVPILAVIIKQHGMAELPYITILAGLFLLFFVLLVIGVGAGLLLHLGFAAHGQLRGRYGSDGPVRLSEEEPV